MLLVQAFEHALHDGLTKESRLGRHLEQAAVLIYCRHFFFVKQDYLPLIAHKGSLLLFEKVRINCRYGFLFACTHVAKVIIKK